MEKNKILISTIIAVLLVSSIAVAIDFAAALPLDRAHNSNRLTSASWVRINGFINQSGTTAVIGQLQTQARTATHQSSGENQLTGATAMWTANTTRAIQAVRAKENFTYVYYSARLPNASISSATVDSASNYVLSGTWNLATIISNITIITNEDGTIARVHRDQDITTSKANGELKITGNQFTLNINGLDTLSGTVLRSLTRSWFNPYKVTDDSTSNTVTSSDMHAVTQCYGAMPGWGKYDAAMDFNNNYRVDIADISAVARNM